LVALLLLGVYQAVSHLTTGQYFSAGIFGFGVAIIVKLMFLSDVKQAQKLAALAIFWLAFSISSYSSQATDALLWLFVLAALTYTQVPSASANILNVSGFLLVNLIGGYASTTILFGNMFPAIVFFVVLSVVVGQKRKAFNLLQEARTIDVVTGCLNAQQFKQEVRKAAGLHGRYATQVSHLALKFDDEGDLLRILGQASYEIYLRELAQVCQSRLRNTDVLCRYGEGLFMVLLPSTDHMNATHLAKDLVKSCDAYDFSYANEKRNKIAKSLQKIQLNYQICQLNQNENWESWLSRSVK